MLDMNRTLARLCARHATWGHANCISKDCGSTPVILNGAYKLLSTSNTTYASLANVTCDVGYESNVSQIMCQANATWATAKCIPNDCGAVPAVLNGRYTLLNTTNTTYGSLANVTCDAGYESNVSQVMCQANATWGHANCIPKDCGSTPVILNGAYKLLNTTNTTYASLANVTCDVGYESNVSQIMCQANATWATAKCIPNDCGAIPAVLNGRYTLLNTTNTTYGSLANVTCDAGYESNVSQVICQANATWGHANCIPKDCGSTPVILNGAYKLLNTTNTKYASLANVTCDVGYESNVSQIMCQANATWATAKCIPNDCGAVPAVLNGRYTLLNTTNTTYGSLANVTCDAGYESNVSQVMCQANATWRHAHCVPKDCDRLENPQHGDIRNPMNTSTYGTIVTFTCTNGYTLTGSSVRRCAVTGQSVAWNGTITTCVIKDCGPLSKPDNGDVVLNAGTKFEAVANYSCNEGFKLVGDTSRICKNTGTWSGVQPTCAKNGSQIVVCTANTDSRGMDWVEVLAGEMRTQSCEAGFTGNVTRKCLEDGKWQLPNYNCIRTAVNNALIAVDSLQANSTTSDVVDALTQIANVTNQDQQTNASSLLTNAEITSISNSLETVANLVEEKGLVTPDVAKNFFKSASNLLDDKNKGSWQSMQESKSNGGEKVLSSVDKLGEALRNKIQNGTDGFNTSTTIIETNVAIEVKKVKKQDVKFPTTSITTDSSKDDWVKDSQSSIRLDAEALGNNDVVVTAIMYKDMSDILPASSEDITVSTTGTVLNGPVLSFSIFPKVENLDPPVTIVFKHSQTNLSSAACSYWKFGSANVTGKWSSDGCTVRESNNSFTVCDCSHLTNFAVLMSPFVEADSESIPLRVVSIVGIGLSMLCLLITILIHVCLWKYLKSERAVLLLNLSIALLSSYIIFLAGVDRTESTVFCAVVAALLQYIYLVVFCLMLAEGIELAVTVLYVFATRSRLRVLVVSAWLLPAIVVGISLGVTKAEGYGNEHFCWLSISRGLIWSFIGPALVIIIFNIICLILVIRKMCGMKSMETKTSAEKIKTSLRSLCVLVPLMGVSWILGIFYINDNLFFMQYLFAICNGLQGVFIFIFHCVLNKKVRQALKRDASRRETLRETLRSTRQSTFQSTFQGENNYSSSNKFNSESRSEDAEFTSSDWRNKVSESKSESSGGQFYVPLVGEMINRIRRPALSVNSRALPRHSRDDTVFDNDDSTLSRYNSFKLDSVGLGGTSTNI
ncbi:hypothetical protein DPMN_052416 [Dreissena polymorpha]|uniref:Uncharacterized protein n=1 Tax=Dreissena polymorpha TaxID=45954 RepID=A0A9D4HPB1_DREPO|nr:hypothetical protein DPMN_052416 [Dreissena polymorpha]